MVYRAALIGCGKIGSEFADDSRVDGIYSHAGAYAACPETTLAAVCDVDALMLERCGERWGVPARFSEAQQLLDEQHPDIVSICTPDETHYALIRAAIVSSGVRAVLAEKPLTLTLDQANELVRLADERAVVLAVNYSRRFAESHLKLCEFVRAGGIGEIQTVGGYYSKGILHNGTHWFDLARLLVGEVTRVWGFDRLGEGGDDPTLDAVLEFSCGASAHLQACDAKAFSLFEMDLIGTLGRVRIIESGHAFEFYHVSDSPYYSGYSTLTLKDRTRGGLQDVLLSAVEDVVGCLATGRRPRCSGADAVAVLEIALAARVSARSGQAVTLSEK